MIEDNKKSRVLEILKTKPIYPVLALCLVAIGIVAYSSNRGLPTDEGVTPLTPPAEAITQAPTDEVGGDVTGMPDERKTTVPPTVPTTAAEPKTTVPSTKAQPAYFSLPLGTDISLDFSYGELVFSKTMNDWRVHNGVDFSGKVGDTVKSIADGTVLNVFDDELWGTVVEVDHGGGIIAKYCGLGRGSTAKKGDKLKMNDTVGMLGTIPVEEAQGAHVHLEIRVNGKVSDPLTVMGKGASPVND